MKNIIHKKNIKAHDLPGRSLKWLITPDMDVSDNLTMNVVVIKPGNTVKPAHSHPTKEELIYITSGKGRVYIDGKVYDVGKGTAVLFKPGSIHMVQNNGSEDMEIACIFSPPATKEDYAFHQDIDFPD